MLLELAPEWSMDIDRGPDWLFIRLQPPNNQNAAHGGRAEAPLAEMVWKKLEQCFCYRVVLELEPTQVEIIGEDAQPREKTPEEHARDRKRRSDALGTFMAKMVKELSEENRRKGGDGNVSGFVVG